MFKTLLTASTLAVLSTTALARESIAISGSSTVLPDLLKPDGWEAPSHEGNHGTFSNIL